MANNENEMKIQAALKQIQDSDTSEQDLSFKAGILKSFFAKRDVNYIPKPSGIEQQKFILFYSLFSYINGKKDYSFCSLKAFPKGPVYKDVHALANKNIYANNLNVPANIPDEKIFEMTLLLLYLFGETGISELTHSLEFWKKTKQGYDCNIEKNGLSINDRTRLEVLYKELLETSEKFKLFQNCNNKILLIQKEHFDVITRNHLGELNQYDKTTIEPVYVYLVEGELVFD